MKRSRNRARETAPEILTRLQSLQSQSSDIVTVDRLECKTSVLDATGLKKSRAPAALRSTRPAKRAALGNVVPSPASTAQNETSAHAAVLSRAHAAAGPDAASASPHSSAEAIFQAVCMQVGEAASARARAEERARTERRAALQRVIRESESKPWLVRRAIDAEVELEALDRKEREQQNQQHQQQQKNSAERGEDSLHVGMTAAAGIDRQPRSRCDSRVTAARPRLPDREAEFRRRSAEQFAAAFARAARPMTELGDSETGTATTTGQRRALVCPVGASLADAASALQRLSHVSGSEDRGSSPECDDAAQAASADDNVDALCAAADETFSAAVHRAADTHPPPSDALTALQAEVLDAMLAEHGLPLQFLRPLRGDICDACPGGVQMRIAINESLLECPQCGVARKLTQSTAANSSSGNDLDFSSHTSGKQKTRVVDMLEFTQGIGLKRPKADVLRATMEHMWARAQPTLNEAAASATAATVAATMGADRLLSDEQRSQDAVRAAAESVSSTSAARAAALRGPCGQLLEAHADEFAAEVAARGPFASAEDAETRLATALPCLRAHLQALSYHAMYGALQGTHESLRTSLKALQAAADGKPGAGSRSSGAAAKGKSKTKQPIASTTTSALGENEVALGDAAQRLSDLAALAKDVNASYELAAKVGAALGGYHGLAMTSQQREHIHALHAKLHAVLEKLGARTRLPHRFQHEIRQLCIMSGLHEFLPLYPLPHAIGAPPLAVLEETLRAPFEALGWTFTPAQVELSSDCVDVLVEKFHVAAREQRSDILDERNHSVHQSILKQSGDTRKTGRFATNLGAMNSRSAILEELGISVCTVKGKKRFFQSM